VGGEMILRNITITPKEAVMAVFVDGTELDLHNGGTFIGYRYSVATRELEMTWHCDLWPKNQGVCLTLNFSNVHFLEITARDPEMPVEEDETLSFLVLNLIDNNSKESQIEFNFFGGMKILVKAEELFAQLDNL
jgi:hypothetical protein